ncbi:MAG: helicase, partial [Acidimicrobiia bacterium]|nr:helicase [Acidimicrobiia bacterium]
MTLTDAQRAALDHLRAAYVGPEGGPDEVLYNRPHLQYSVGMLFPTESLMGESGEASQERNSSKKAVGEGDVEESGAAVPLAEDWRPSSVALSFVTDSPSAICEFSAGTYQPVSDEGPPRWQRRQFDFSDIGIEKGAPLQQLTAGSVPFEIGSRWREYGDAFLVTVLVRLATQTTGDDKIDIAQMLFQVRLTVRPAVGGTILEYDTSRTFDIDAESAELRLRYRNRKVFGIGHGMAAEWVLRDGTCQEVWLNPVPSYVVPSVETTSFQAGTEESRALSLAHLSKMDTAPDDVLPTLDAFVHAFSNWVSEQEVRVDEFGARAPIARAIVDRSCLAVRRMEAGVEILRHPEQVKLREAFALGMAAMRLQMRQAGINRTGIASEPNWRPFQLGFLLVSLASTVDDGHAERELVDLIWFPTGGGKTEAYLALAAVEIFRRRLEYGSKGGGTAVITRYTLRLLTAQQFQRAAALVCAMELLRGSDPRVSGMLRFTIGLWVGNEVTPATLGVVEKALERLHKAARPEEANGFQVESCPWCQAPLVPTKRSIDARRYGFRLSGRDLLIHCTDESCAFHGELPLRVIDSVLYDDPPTILLATVDKFARLQFKPEAGKLLGLGTAYRQPSMIIQDELHLLSGPLGTTVAVFDAVIQLLLSRSGSRPKIIAS